jgi:integrase
VVEEPREEPTFHEFASEWLEARRHQLGERTAEDYTWALSVHLLPFFARYRVEAITIEDVDRYRTSKVREGRLAARSINKTITRLAQILEVAEEYGYIERNPAKGRRRRVKAAAPSRTWLDRAEQITALLQAARELDGESRPEARPQREIILGTVTFTGLRIGELLALRWRDVDLAAGRLKVVDSKTNAGVRHIDLLPVLREALTAWKARCRDSRPSDLVFRTTSGGAHNPSNVRVRFLGKAVARANERLDVPLPEVLTPHSLRRTFASLLFSNGDELPYVMDQLGHTHANMTLGIYAHVMQRKDGERERLKWLVNGVDWAQMGTTADSARSAREPERDENPSTMQVAGP